VRGTAAPILTVLPDEPSGQVPIGGWSAKAEPMNPTRGPPADKTLKLAPVATARRSRRRRDINLENRLLPMFIGNLLFVHMRSGSVTAFSRGGFNRRY
jgi:hypothetical protein